MHRSGMMIDSERKKVVFRIAGVGFSLAVDTLMEIRETGDVAIDHAAADPGQHVLGRFPFRGDEIALLDIRRLFALPQDARDPVLAIVLGADGAWGFPLQDVLGFAPGGELLNREVPALLLGSGALPFSTIDIWRNEPLVCFEPAVVERFRESAG